MFAFVLAFLLVVTTFTVRPQKAEAVVLEAAAITALSTIVISAGFSLTQTDSSQAALNAFARQLDIELRSALDSLVAVGNEIDLTSLFSSGKFSALYDSIVDFFSSDIALDVDSNLFYMEQTFSPVTDSINGTSNYLMNISVPVQYQLTLGEFLEVSSSISTKEYVCQVLSNGATAGQIYADSVFLTGSSTTFESQDGSSISPDYWFVAPYFNRSDSKVYMTIFAHLPSNAYKSFGSGYYNCYAYGTLTSDYFLSSDVVSSGGSTQPLCHVDVEAGAIPAGVAKQAWLDAYANSESIVIPADGVVGSQAEALEQAGALAQVDSIAYPVISNYQAVSELNGSRLVLGDIFPFCIPFDVYDFLVVMNAAREAPCFTVPLDFGVVGDFSITIDLASFDSVAAVLRLMELLAFCVGLAVETRKLIRG